MYRTIFLLLSVLLLSHNTLAQSDWQFSSGEQQVATIELFTSHGCSSCPPADAWLRKYLDHPGLWTEVIPLAFHVDYWDYLGWPDEFANRFNTHRQQNYAASKQVSSVYTPGLVVNGREWRGFFRGRQPDLSTNQTIGSLSLSTDLQSATVQFTPNNDTAYDRLSAHIAILGFGIESDIGAGENRGRVLAEDFVVLGHNSTQQSSGNNTWTLAVPSTVTADTSRLAMVAWISNRRSPAPLQATGGWVSDQH